MNWSSSQTTVSGSSSTRPFKQPFLRCLLEISPWGCVLGGILNTIVLHAVPHTKLLDVVLQNPQVLVCAQS